jgi:formate dehydrogenase maturation protein FdhE
MATTEYSSQLVEFTCSRCGRQKRIELAGLTDSEFHKHDSSPCDECGTTGKVIVLNSQDGTARFNPGQPD